MGAKKAFVLLGLNDLGYRKWADVEENFVDLIEVIREKCPDTELVIQAVLPVTSAFCRERGLKIENWNGFNGELRRICEERQVGFYDFTALFMDEKGYMKPGYSDGGFHLSADGAAVWLRALRLYAAQRLYPGAELQVDAPVTLIP